MRDRKVTPDMAAVIKRARMLREPVPYSWISGYYPNKMDNPLIFIVL